jgi:hypothetical protein
VDAKSPNTGRIAEITKQAAEIAAAVPEHLQEAAFNRAFDALSESGGPQELVRRREPSTGGRRGKRARASTKPEPDDGSSDPTSVLISSLSRTDHPEITGASRSLDRALYLLQIAERDHGIDGLTALQIAKVLTDKFRHRVTRQAIGQTLNGAGSGYVDFTPQAKGAAIYRLMAPGEKYLDGLAEGETKAEGKTGAASVPKPKRRARRAPTQQKATKVTENVSNRKRSGRSPKGLVEELIADGFFTGPKTIGDIQEQLRHKKGVQLKATDLSPALVRLLREKSLDRERNESNQYEYNIPS